MRPARRFDPFPPVIIGLLLVNGGLFLAQGILPELFRLFALWPLEAPAMVMTPDGPMRVPEFHWYQLLTYGFLHGGPFHLFVNLFALWMFGVPLENAWGSRRFALYFLICIAGAGLVQLLVVSAGGDIHPTIGASGGVFGVLLAFGVTWPNQRLILLFPPIPLKAKWFVLIFGAIELWLGVTGTQAGVAHFAHLGGMLFGGVLLLAWRGRVPHY